MRPYAKLRGALAEIDMGQRELAIRLGKSKTYVMERMTARKPWDLSDCYTILDLFKVSQDQLAEFFPQNGGVANWLGMDSKKSGGKKCG